MANYPYKVATDDNGTYLITFPDFPEAVTFAENEDEIEARAQDAIDTAIQGRISDKELIPLPRLSRHGFKIRVGGVKSAKVGLWNIMWKRKVTKAQLARKLDCAPPQVDRLLDPRHASRFDQIEDALEVLDGAVAVTVTERPLHNRPRIKTMASSKRDTYKYLFKVGNKIVHGGITNDLERREQEHQQKWSGGHIKQVGRRTTEDAARKWEKDKGYVTERRARKPAAKRASSRA